MLNKVFTDFPVLTTERLSLRQPVIADENEIFTLRSDSEINKYLNRQACLTIGDARDFITAVNENIQKKDSLYWAITLRGNNILIGTICLFGFLNENKQCEIGYELLTNFQRQGIMKEAVEKVIDFAFNTMHVEKIEAFLHRNNLQSIKLLEKFAFRKSHEPNNSNPNLVCYQVTNSKDARN